MIEGNLSNSLIRQIKGKVELYEGSTLLETFSYNDKLAEIEVSREGEGGKFFGFGVCQKLTVKITDKDRELDIQKGIHHFKVYLTDAEAFISPFPLFYVEEVKRNEKTNELTITAYDLLYNSSNIIFEEAITIRNNLEEGEELTPITYAGVLAITIGLPWKIITVGGISIPMLPIKDYNFTDDDETNPFLITYPQGANLEGTETCREVLDDIAEMTQSIYYIDRDGYLVFKRLDRDGDAVLTISKADYFELSNKMSYTLNAIYHTTQLGDNVSDEESTNINKDYEASIGNEGARQYVRDNAFWENREDIGTIVDNALAAIGGLTIHQFSCSWRGNFLLEPGDKISLTTKDNETITSYVLNDKLVYNGGMKQTTSWEYKDSEGETPSNPASLGEALNRTFARVDKVNKNITMLASDISANTDEVANLSKLILDPDGIQATVQSIQEATDEAIENINGEIDTLTKSVELAMTDEAVEIKINEALSNGVSSVETTSGFTFNQDGLKVSSSDSDIYTLIDETGMKVSIGDDPDPVLAATNDGVNAMNLTARQFLIIGERSRFEDYGTNRTGCFWIGG